MRGAAQSHLVPRRVLLHMIPEIYVLRKLHSIESVSPENPVLTETLFTFTPAPRITFLRAQADLARAPATAKEAVTPVENYAAAVKT